MHDLLFHTACQQLRALRAGKVSAAELAEAHIEQIERLNPSLGALVDFDPDRVRQQARSARLGRLAGLPVTIKSSIATQGHLCEIGSTLHRGQRPAHDAAAVATLRREGAIFLGTTNCPEFLMAYETGNDLYGASSNPWSLAHSAGGSSGGEAAAIAAGMSAAGLGSDSGGSVRVPASFTGICALKPTAGRISAEGHLPPCVGPFARLGAIGPMARSVEDLHLLFDLLAEPAAQRPTLQQLRQTPIGFLVEDGAGTDPEVQGAVLLAVEALRAAGFTVEAFHPKGLQEAEALWRLFFVQCGAMFYSDTISGRHGELSPIFREFLASAERMGPLSAEALLRAWADWDLLCPRLLAQMGRYPLWLTPPCAVPAFRHGERAWPTGTGTVAYLEAMRYTQWFNVLAAPAAVVPVTQSSAGLPLGVQIGGRPHRDEWVLALAAVLDGAFGYRVPPLAWAEASTPAPPG